VGIGALAVLRYRLSIGLGLCGQRISEIQVTRYLCPVATNPVHRLRQTGVGAHKSYSSPAGRANGFIVCSHGTGNIGEQAQKGTCPPYENRISRHIRLTYRPNQGIQADAGLCWPIGINFSSDLGICLASIAHEGGSLVGGAVVVSKAVRTPVLATCVIRRLCWLPASSAAHNGLRNTNQTQIRQFVGFERAEMERGTG